MASNADYESFLNKANQDVSGEGETPQQGNVETQSEDSSISVPEVLKSVDVWYSSDADEPFEPVALEWDGEWPRPDQFASLISPETDTDPSKRITILSWSEFDQNNEYSVALKAVREAVGKTIAEVQVYRFEYTETKIEYWILALHQSEKRLVGFRAKAAET